MQLLGVTLPGRIDPRVLGLGLLGALSLTVGYVGQGSWGVGEVTPPAASAIVTDVIGGVGSRQPVRVEVALAVTNSGTDQVRVLGPDASGLGSGILALVPDVLLVEPGETGLLDADVTVDCEYQERLQLPDLRLELRDGIRRDLPIGGSGRLLEACSRAAPEVRPLAATLPTGTAEAVPDGSALPVRFSSPTGRRTEVLAVRADGVELLLPVTPTTVSGRAPVPVPLTAPPTCPIQWQVSGIPSALTVDLRAAPGPDRQPMDGPGNPEADPGATIRLRLGPALTTWLLATACAAGP